MSGVLSWINKGANALPDWATAHVTREREPNGSFMIRTVVGTAAVQARVNVGQMLIERKGVAYARYPAEARSFLNELDILEMGSSHLPQIGASGPMADVAPRDDDTDEISLRIAEAARSQPTRHAPVQALSPAKLEPVARRFAAAKGMPPSIENRHPSELRIDDSYQRSIDSGPSRSLIAKIAAAWDWRMCMPLVVSKRDDGSLYVIDGQHRQAAALLRGDIPFLPCCVGVYASIADEAAMFVAMNRARRAINRLDDFHAAQAGGDKEALAIAKIVEAVGFTVSRKTGSATWIPGEVAFTSAIAVVYRKHGASLASKALAAMAAAFPDQRLVAGSSVFTAIARVMVSPPDGFDEGRLDAALRKFDMQGWADFLKGAKGGDDRAQKLREVLLMAYDEAGQAAP